MVLPIPSDESARAALINTADRYFWCLIVSTIILFIGAIVEYFNPFEWLRKSSLSIGTNVRASRRWARSIVVSERLAIAMVVGGIGGEGIFEYLAARAESAVREFDSTVSIAARNRADEAERQTTNLRVAMADRNLSPEQQRTIRDTCLASPWKGRDVWMRSYPDDGEAARLIVEMKAAFEPCLTVEDRSGQGGIAGTLVGIRVDPSEHDRAFAAFLIGALRGKNTGNLSVDDITPFGSASETTEILVGLKPAALTQVVSDLNKKAESEAVSRAKIEERLAGRRITPEQHDKFVATLRRYRGSVVTLTKLGDKEAGAFADDIIKAFVDSGWNPRITQIGVIGPPVYGVSCAFDRTTDAGKALSNALVEIIPTTKIIVSSPNSGIIADITVGLRLPP